MAVFVEMLAFLSLILIANEIKAMLCTIGQETDPETRRFRWLIQEEDPCLCTVIAMGGMNSYVPDDRDFKVTYYDTFFLSSDPVEIRRWLKCPAIRCAVNDHLAPVNGGTTGCSGDYGESCMLSCDQGFKPTTSMVVTCKSDDSGDGVWSTMCTQITCALSDLHLPGANTEMTGCSGDDPVPYGTNCTLTYTTTFIPASIKPESCELLTEVNINVGQTAGSIMCRDEWLAYKHVGLEYRSIIPDDRLAASSRYYSNGYRPAKDGRLNNNWHWCATLSDSNPWIEVDLMTSTVVSGVITQGSTSTPSRVTQYQVAYQTTSSPTYVHALSATENIMTFSGNLDDAATPVIQFFQESINATRVKIEPLDWYQKGVKLPCLRFELLGCRLN